MAKQFSGPRPTTRLGLSSDVRAANYQTRVKPTVKRGAKSPKPRTAKQPQHQQGRGGREP